MAAAPLLPPCPTPCLPSPLHMVLLFREYTQEDIFNQEFWLYKPPPSYPSEKILKRPSVQSSMCLMAVGGSTTVPPWMQALESKYWNMCLCLGAQWWAHFKDLNNNSDGDVASPSTTAVPELHSKESCGHFADYTFFRSFMWCLQPDPCCPHTCFGSLLSTFPAIFSVLKCTLSLPMGSWQLIYSKEMTKFPFFSSL